MRQFDWSGGPQRNIVLTLCPGLGEYEITCTSIFYGVAKIGHVQQQRSDCGICTVGSRMFHYQELSDVDCCLVSDSFYVQFERTHAFKATQ